MQPRPTDPHPPAVRAPAPQRNGVANEVVAYVLVSTVGGLLAIMPHLANYASAGHLEYLTDQDDVVYLGITRSVYYYGEPRLTDPYASRRESFVELHAWAQFVPLAVLARGLGLPLVLQAMLWRAVGGVMLGSACYFLFRRLLARTRRPMPWALGCSVVVLGDPGLVTGRPLIDGAGVLVSMIRGTLTHGNQLSQYRVVTPLLNLPFLLVLLGSLMDGWLNRLRDVALGIVGMGACVLLYFYFWTAAVLGIGLYVTLLLGLAWWSPAHRRALLLRAVMAMIVVTGGLALGSQQILSNLRLARDPEVKPLLERAGRGTSLPPGDPRRMQYLANYTIFAKLAVGATLIAALRRRDPRLGLSLALLWCMGLAGYLLMNVAVVTGLEYQNFHWVYVTSPATMVMLLAGASALLDQLRPAGATAAALWAIPVALVAFATAERAYEARHAELPSDVNATIEATRPLRPALAQLDPDSLIAGQEAAEVAYLWSPAGLLLNRTYTARKLMPLEEAHERYALNAWLRGLDPEQFAAEASSRPDRDEIPFPSGETLPEAMQRARVAQFAELLKDPERARQLMDRYRVRYLLRTDGSGTPGRGGPWTRIASGNGLTLWDRGPHRLASPAHPPP